MSFQVRDKTNDIKDPESADRKDVNEALRWAQQYQNLASEFVRVIEFNQEVITGIKNFYHNLKKDLNFRFGNDASAQVNGLPGVELNEDSKNFIKKFETKMDSMLEGLGRNLTRAQNAVKEVAGLREMVWFTRRCRGDCGIYIYFLRENLWL